MKQVKTSEVDLAFMLRDSGYNIEAVQRRIDRYIKQIKETK